MKIKGLNNSIIHKRADSLAFLKKIEQSILPDGDVYRNEMKDLCLELATSEDSDEFVSDDCFDYALWDHLRHLSRALNREWEK